MEPAKFHVRGEATRHQALAGGEAGKERTRTWRTNGEWKRWKKARPWTVERGAASSRSRIFHSHGRNGKRKLGSFFTPIPLHSPNDAEPLKLAIALFASNRDTSRPSSPPSPPSRGPLSAACPVPNALANALVGDAKTSAPCWVGFRAALVMMGVGKPGCPCARLRSAHQGSTPRPWAVVSAPRSNSPSSSSRPFLLS